MVPPKGPKPDTRASLSLQKSLSQAPQAQNKELPTWSPLLLLHDGPKQGTMVADYLQSTSQEAPETIHLLVRTPTDIGNITEWQ